MISKDHQDIIVRRSQDMTSLSQVEDSLKHIFEERANVLARETGCIQRQRKFSGADLLQTLVFGWLSHPVCIQSLVSGAASQHRNPAPLQGNGDHGIATAAVRYRRCWKLKRRCCARA